MLTVERPKQHISIFLSPIIITYDYYYFFPITMRSFGAFQSQQGLFVPLLPIQLSILLPLTLLLAKLKNTRYNLFQNLTVVSTSFRDRKCESMELKEVCHWHFADFWSLNCSEIYGRQLNLSYDY